MVLQYTEDRPPPHTRPEAWPIFDIDIKGAWIEPGSSGARIYWIVVKVAQVEQHPCVLVGRRIDFRERAMILWIVFKAAQVEQQPCGLVG